MLQHPRHFLTDLSVEQRQMHIQIRACSFVAPGSTLPPTNSHNSPRDLWAGRWQMRDLFPLQIRAATTSVTFFHAGRLK